MKNRIILLIGIASLIFIQSCSDYLDVEPKTFFTRELYYNSPTHAQQAVTACYAPLRTVYGGAGTYGESAYFMLEFATGTCLTSIGQSIYNMEFKLATTQANNRYVWYWWYSYYEGIENCNIALEKLPDIPDISANDLSHFTGEVYFLRAWYYFMLVQIFGDVPIRVTPTTSIEGVPRSPVDEVYQLIVSDLLEAEKTTLPNTSTSGKVTKGAVKSLLAKVYLTMAGYPLQNTGMYAQAAAKAQEVITSGWYDLFPDIDDLRDRNNRNIVEHIFQTQFAVGIATHSIHPWMMPRYSRISNYSDEFGCFYPDPAFLTTFDPADKRVQEKGWFYSNYPLWADNSIIVEFTTPHVYKFFDDAAQVSRQGDQNYPNLRYADILLIYAEAQNEADGSPNALALECYNKVRNRAGLANKSAADFASQNDFREAVWKERWWELCFENQNWFDMARTRKVLNLNNNSMSNFVGYEFKYNELNPSDNYYFRLTEKQFLFPIPLQDLEADSKLIQNPGY